MVYVKGSLIVTINMRINMITQEELKALLDYDEVTGVFTWKVTGRFNPAEGKQAGTNHLNYIRIAINRRSYQAHRLAWLYVKGEFPALALDHIDGVKSNNSISNLREASPHQNLINIGRYKNNSSGFKGVSYHKSSGKWVSGGMLKGKYFHLGSFNTPEEASLAYQEFALKNHGEFIHNSVSTALAN